jgi:hypothetical protein
MILGKDVLNADDKRINIANKAYFIQMLILEARGPNCCITTEDMSEDGDTFTCNKCGRKWEVVTFEHSTKMICVG